jgi:transcriptional regulator with XRE-family HTH domain
VADDVSVGRQLRAVRLSRGLRQEDVAARIGFSRSAVSRLEGGRFDGVPVATLRAISRALSMPPILTLGWRGPEVDRLLDETHSAMVEAVAAELSALGWRVLPEHSFSEFGERGAVDILAWHGQFMALLVIETKARIWNLQETLAVLDRKRRLARVLASRDFGWQPVCVGTFLVMPERRANRALVERRAATFASALPARQLEVRAWLQRPDRDLRGIWFLHNSHVVHVLQRAPAKRRRARARARDENGIITR